MAFQTVPNVAEVVITYSGHGQQFKNIVHGLMPGGYVLADLVTLAAAVDLAIAANWLPIQSVDYIYLNTTVRGLEFENDQEVTNSVSSGNGLGTATAVPDNVTLSIKKSSGLTGRSARGRLYWIGTLFADLATNENVYVGIRADGIVAAVDALRVAIEATAWQAVIVSRFTNGLPRAFGLAFPWIDSVAVNNDVDSQRSRLIN